MIYTIHDMPITERPRERLITKGPQSLSDYELLAIILRTGTKDLTVLELAQNIIMKEGNIGKFNNITISELKCYKGVKTAKAIEILAAVEFGKRVCKYSSIKQVIKKSEDVFNLLKYDMENLESEQIKVLYLNYRSEIIEIKTISLGNTNSTQVDIKEILKWSLKLSSHHFIVCHNHPTGNPEPSFQDRVFTNDLISLSKSMDITLVDHIIIGKNKYYSFHENINKK